MTECDINLVALNIVRLSSYIKQMTHAKKQKNGFYPL